MPTMGRDDPHFGYLRGIVDVELTNRCNAHCGFCPRDQTPHQGVMKPEVWERTLERTVEFYATLGGDWRSEPGISFCGLGDQLIHPHTADIVRDVRAAGLAAAVNTNAALLDERRGMALLDAGTSYVFVNGGEIGPDYESLYGLSFERVSTNVANFVAASRDTDTRLYVVLVDHLQDRRHVAEVAAYWRSLGVRRFYRLDLLNRAGALHVDGMDFSVRPRDAEARALLEATGKVHACRAPLQFPIVGYDGNYYLCSSDWRKDVAVGNVFEHSFLDVLAPKLQAVISREPICKFCNHDPVNRVASALEAQQGGGRTEVDLAAVLDALDEDADDLALIRAHLEPYVARTSISSTPTIRRRVPVEVVDDRGPAVLTS